MGSTQVRLAAEMLYRVRGGPVLCRAPSWSGVLVLNYHRIGDAATAPFFKDVYSATADDFDRQLAFLKRHTDVIGAYDLGTVLRSGRGRHVMITFDDGYRDNHDAALPLLKAHGLPATFFICTGFIDDGPLAWWDELAWIARESPLDRLPPCTWFPAGLPLASDRESALRGLMNGFRSLPGEQTAAYLAAVADLAGTGRAPRQLADDQWMTWDMARDLAAAGMTIGAHTETHPILSRLDPARQAHEIIVSRDRLTAELGTAPRVFSYPVGKPSTFSRVTKRLIRDAGFDHAFSFYGGHQRFAAIDHYDLPRTYVDWDTTMAEFEAKVSSPHLFARW